MIGSIVGTGVFTLPAVMAGAGTMSLFVLGVVAVGALLLGVLFGQLTRRVPNSDGGPYAYARHEFGDFAGYLTGWCYWITSWAGNAAIVSSWVFYVNALFWWDDPPWLANWGIAMVGLWVPAAINLVGIRQVAWFQNVTVVLKFLPLLFVGVVGWFLSARPTSARSTPRAAACTAPSGSRRAWPCSRSSASRPRRSPPSGCGTPGGTWAGRRSSEPRPALSCTWSPPER